MTADIQSPKSNSRIGAILFVEDDPEDFAFARNQLRRTEVANPTHCVGSAEEMIKYVHGTGDYSDRESYPFPAVIVMDLRLPGSNGLQAQAYLRTKLKFRKIPIIAISSEEQLNSLRSAVSLGADGLLVKPFDVTQFNRVAEQKGLPVQYRRD
jgi:CheY-like chemotaxis protein